MVSYDLRRYLCDESIAASRLTENPRWMVVIACSVRSKGGLKLFSRQTYKVGSRKYEMSQHSKKIWKNKFLKMFASHRPINDENGGDTKFRTV